MYAPHILSLPNCHMHLGRLLVDNPHIIVEMSMGERLSSDPKVIEID